MKTNFLIKTAVLTMIFLTGYGCGSDKQIESNSSSIEDSAKISQRPDGTFDVLCKDGSREFATKNQVQIGSICERENAQLNAHENATNHMQNNELMVFSIELDESLAEALGQNIEGLRFDKFKRLTLHSESYVAGSVNGTWGDEKLTSFSSGSTFRSYTLGQYRGLQGYYLKLQDCGTYVGTCSYDWTGIYNSKTKSYDGEISIYPGHYGVMRAFVNGSHPGDI